MKIALKFCGGCNSKYDRNKVSEILKTKLSKHQIEYVKDNATYDYTFIINGCQRACASYKEFNTTKEVFSIFSLESFDEILKTIEFLF